MIRTVRRARDTRLDRDVAIKILPEGFAADSAARERFQREAKSIAALNHPHICTLHDIGDDGPMAFLVMELVEGETLAATIVSRPLSLPRRSSSRARSPMPWIRRIARALRTAISNRPT